MKTFFVLIFLSLLLVGLLRFQFENPNCDTMNEVKMMENDIAIVVPTRIDDYGMNASGRFFRMLVNTSRSFPRAEILVIDWGSDQEGIEEMTRFVTKWSLSNVQIILVDQTTTNRYPFFMEYVAKNVGIRRATRKYVLTINQDALFTKETADMLRFGNLNDFVFYRMKRVEAGEFQRREVISSSICSQKCSKDVRKIEITPHTHYKTCRKTHNSNPGDFIMTTKDNWMRVGGFQESTNKSEIGIDVIMAYKFNFFGIGEQFLLEPCVILHQPHRYDREYRFKSGANEKVKQVHDCVKDFIMDNRMDGPCFKTNPSSWGLRELNFKIIDF